MDWHFYMNSGMYVHISVYPVGIVHRDIKCPCVCTYIHMYTVYLYIVLVLSLYPCVCVWILRGPLHSWAHITLWVLLSCTLLFISVSTHVCVSGYHVMSFPYEYPSLSCVWVLHMLLHGWVTICTCLHNTDCALMLSAGTLDCVCKITLKNEKTMPEHDLEVQTM